MSDETVNLVRVCGSSHLLLGQGELGTQIGSKLDLLPIHLRVHYPGKGGMVNLLLQKGDPAFEMDHPSVSAVRGMGILPWNVHPGICIRRAQRVTYAGEGFIIETLS